MIQEMHVIGYWITSVYDDRFLAPQEIAGQLPTHLVDTVSAYLRAGQVFAHYRGGSFCRFLCSDSENLEDYRSANGLGGSELTDGYWIWPDGLIHYVEEHQVGLPEAFLSDVLRGEARNRHFNPDITFEAWMEREEYIHSPQYAELDFWTEWCKQNQNPAFRKQLLLARKRADQLAENALRELSTELNAKSELSEEVCLQAGCEAFALAGMAFCPIHHDFSLIESSRREIDYSMLGSLLRQANTLKL